MLHIVNPVLVEFDMKNVNVRHSYWCSAVRNNQKACLRRS